MRPHSGLVLCDLNPAGANEGGRIGVSSCSYKANTGRPMAPASGMTCRWVAAAMVGHGTVEHSCGWWGASVSKAGERHAGPDQVAQRGQGGPSRGRRRARGRRARAGVGRGLQAAGHRECDVCRVAWLRRWQLGAHRCRHIRLGRRHQVNGRGAVRRPRPARRDRSHAWSFRSCRGRGNARG